MSFESKLDELGIILPKANPPVGSYQATKIVDKLFILIYNIHSSFSMDPNRSSNDLLSLTFYFSSSLMLPLSKITKQVKSKNKL